MTPTAASESAPAPVLFLGHGNPMHAITENPWADAWQSIGGAIRTPRAILCVSAHWWVNGLWVMANERPRTIHDFGGFPRELFEVQYPAPGDPRLAERIVRLLDEERAAPSEAWGLDHGTWSVVRHLRPDADVPVLQLSLDRQRTPAEHLAIARALAPLRDEGVLVVGSGNITHNLGHAMRGGGYALWAEQFDREAATRLAAHDAEAVMRLVEHETYAMAHPTPDHFLPLIYAAGLVRDDDALSFPVEGFDMGSLSMRSLLAGRSA